MQIMIKLSWTDWGEVKSLILNELGTTNQPPPPKNQINNLKKANPCGTKT